MGSQVNNNVLLFIVYFTKFSVSWGISLTIPSPVDISTA